MTDEPTTHQPTTTADYAAFVEMMQAALVDMQQRARSLTDNPDAQPKDLVLLSDDGQTPFYVAGDITPDELAVVLQKLFQQGRDIRTHFDPNHVFRPQHATELVPAKIEAAGRRRGLIVGYTSSLLWAIAVVGTANLFGQQWLADIGATTRDQVVIGIVADAVLILPFTFLIQPSIGSAVARAYVRRHHGRR